MHPLEQQLFHDSSLTTYAIISAAATEALIDYLYAENGPQFECLYGDEIAPDIAWVAPYLVKLEEGSAFCEWLMSGWGRHWGVYALLPNEVEFGKVKRHFRSLNMAYNSARQPTFFRYYDPRVLRRVLAVVNPQKLTKIFGPVSQFIMESELPQMAYVFSFHDATLCQQEIEWHDHGSVQKC